MQTNDCKYDDDGNLLLTHRSDDEILTEAQEIVGDTDLMSLDYDSQIERCPGGETARVKAWVTVESRHFAKS